MAVRLPKQIVDGAGLVEGACVDLTVVDGIVKVVPSRPVYALADLVAGITPENIPDGFDDAPHGRELL